MVLRLWYKASDKPKSINQQQNAKKNRRLDIGRGVNNTKISLGTWTYKQASYIAQVETTQLKSRQTKLTTEKQKISSNSQKPYPFKFLRPRVYERRPHNRLPQHLYPQFMHRKMERRTHCTMILLSSLSIQQTIKLPRNLTARAIIRLP